MIVCACVFVCLCNCVCVCLFVFIKFCLYLLGLKQHLFCYIVSSFVCMHVLIQVLLVYPINCIFDIRYCSLDLFKYCHGKISQYCCRWREGNLKVSRCGSEQIVC